MYDIHCKPINLYRSPSVQLRRARPENRGHGRRDRSRRGQCHRDRDRRGHRGHRSRNGRVSRNAGNRKVPAGNLTE